MHMTYLMNITDSGWPKTSDGVYIGRIHGTYKHYGNPFSHTDAPATRYVTSRTSAVMEYLLWLRGHRYTDHLAEQRAWILRQLEAGALLNKKLYCWCTPLACHGTHLMQYQLDLVPATCNDIWTF